MSNVQERLPTPQSFPNVGSSMPPDSQQHETEMPTAKEWKPRLTRACDTCRQKKLRCQHRQIIDEGDAAGSAAQRKRATRTPGPDQTTVQAESSHVHTTTATAQSQNSGSRSQSSQAPVAERPRRLGAGKRKLSDAFDDANVDQRPKRVAVAAAPETCNSSSGQAQQRRKPGPKPRKPSQALSINTPDSERSPSPVERSNLPRTLLPPFTDNLDASTAIGYHKVMAANIEESIKETERKWQRMMGTIQEVRYQWKDVLESISLTKSHMDNWISRFTNVR